MLGRSVVSGLRLHQCGLRGVKIAAGNGSLGEELLAAVHDAGVQVEIGLGLGEVELGLLRIFRHLRLGRRGVGGLRGLIGALVVLRRGGQVGVFEDGKQLAFLYPRAALH